MKKIKKSTKRLLSVILTAAMVAGGVPQPADRVSASGINNETEIYIEASEITESETEGNQTEEVEETISVETETVEETTSVETEIVKETTSVETETVEETTSVETETVEETTSVETETIEEITSVETDTIEETTELETKTVEETTEPETEEGMLSVSAVEDFVISNGILIEYKGTAENVVIPDGVIKIDREVFKNNNTIKTVTCPSSLKYIDAQAFYKCGNLKTVNMNEGLEEIGYEAFYDVPFGEVKSTGEVSLGKVTIPGSVNAVGTAAFAKCKYLGEVVFKDGQNTVLEMYSSILQGPFYECTNLKMVTLPKRLKTIPEYTFYGNKNLEEVVFGQNIEAIGERAFYECTSMKTPTLYEGLVTIGVDAFYRVPCGELKPTGEKVLAKLTIPSTVQYIGRGAFQKCEYLGEIEFKNGETVVLTMSGYSMDGVFSDCVNLKKVKLPDRLKVISEYAFYKNENLEEVQFGKNLTKIDIGAFQNCYKLKAPVLPEGLVTIESEAFNCAALGEKDSKGKLKSNKLTIPSTVQFIGYGAFRNCGYLGEVDFLNGETVVLRIEGWSLFGAFSDCVNLKKVRLPERLKELEYHTFDGCTNLSAILIPEAVTKFGEYIFSYCPNVTIYGVKGSAAETYAKGCKIPFKDKSLFKMGEDTPQNQEENSPKLDTKTVTINVNEENPSGILHIYPMEGYEVDQTSLKLTGNEAFEIKKAENTSTRYIIKVKSGQNVTKGKYKVSLELKTTAKEDKPFKLPLTINATQTIPAVTISNQKAINVYQKDSTGEVCITSDAEIKNIKFTSNAGSNEPRLVQKDVNITEGKFTYKLENVTGQNYKNIVSRGRLVVEFKGYKTSAAYSKDITLKINKKLPAYTAETLTMFIDTELNNASVKVINSADKKAVKISDGYKISLDQTLPANYQSTPQTKDSPLKISVTNGAKSTTLKLLISNSKWIDGLSIPVKCKVTIGKKPVLSFTNSTITLNTIYADKKYKVIETVPYVKGFEGFVFKSVEITGKNAKSNEVYNNGALTIKYENNKIKAELANGGYFSKKTSLSYDIKAVTAQGLTVSGTLKVNIATTAPQLSMKASGSIDLLDRENTAIKYKTALKNYTGEIAKVQLAGENADKFEAVYNDGVIVLKAKSGKQLSINKQYILTVKASLTNGAEIQGNVKFKLKQKTPKLTTNVKKLTMHKSVPGSVYGYQIAVRNINSSKIESIKLVDGFGTFAYDYKDSGKGNLYVLKDAQGKVNKSYKLKFEVTLKDSAENAKPVYVTVNVKYVK